VPYYPLSTPRCQGHVSETRSITTQRNNVIHSSTYSTARYNVAKRSSGLPFFKIPSTSPDTLLDCHNAATPRGVHNVQILYVGRAQSCSTLTFHVHSKLPLSVNADPSSVGKGRILVNSIWCSSQCKWQCLGLQMELYKSFQRPREGGSSRSFGFSRSVLKFSFCLSTSLIDS
jgi:hypothetical protein